LETSRLRVRPPPPIFCDKQKIGGTKASVKNRDKRFSERSAFDLSDNGIIGGFINEN
jgi:hypothetical protein